MIDSKIYLEILATISILEAFHFQFQNALILDPNPQSQLIPTQQQKKQQMYNFVLVVAKCKQTSIIDIN